MPHSTTRLPRSANSRPDLKPRSVSSGGSELVLTTVGQPALLSDAAQRWWGASRPGAFLGCKTIEVMAESQLPAGQNSRAWGPESGRFGGGDESSPRAPNSHFSPAPSHEIPRVL